MIEKKFFNLKNLRRKPLWVFIPLLIFFVVAIYLFVFTPMAEIQKVFTQTSLSEGVKNLITFIIFVVIAAIIFTIGFSFLLRKPKKLEEKKKKQG